MGTSRCVTGATVTVGGPAAACCCAGCREQARPSAATQETVLRIERIRVGASLLRRACGRFVAAASVERRTQTALSRLIREGSPTGVPYLDLAFPLPDAP